MINLTPHAITVRTEHGEITFPPSGSVARVETREVVIGQCPISGAPIIRRQFGEVTGLPENGSSCLVSALVLSACDGRIGVFAPDTGPTAIRENGQVIACTRLVSAS